MITRSPAPTLSLLNVADPCDAESLMATASWLKASASPGPPPRPLRERHIVLLADDDARPVDVASLATAVAQLGGEFIRLRPSTALPADADRCRDFAAVLGSLYDVIACAGVPVDRVHEIASTAAVATFHDWQYAVNATAQALTRREITHGAARDFLTLEYLQAVNRAHVLQALLCRCLGIPGAV